jgi:hypothetical protein
LRALLTPKRQFEGQKPSLELLEGAAGPKKTIRGTEAQHRMSRHSLLKKPNSKQKTESSKNLERVWVTQEGGVPKLQRKLGREII